MKKKPGNELLAELLPAASRRLPVGDAAAIVILAIFVLFVISIPKYDLAAVIAFAAVPLLLATASAIPFRPLAVRMLIASPFILFMAGGNLFLDRAPAGAIGPVTLTGGMISASVIAAKTMVTLSALLTLMACMPFHRFGAALSSLGVPEVFVTQLLLVYRYSFLLAEEAAMMLKARDLRAFNGKGKGIATTARLIGSLLLRTTARGERIYRAMSARGFRRTITLRPRAPLGTGDLVAITASVSLFALLRTLF